MLGHVCILCLKPRNRESADTMSGKLAMSRKLACFLSAYITYTYNIETDTINTQTYIVDMKKVKEKVK